MKSSIDAENNCDTPCEIPMPVKTCLDMLVEAGYEAWLVGGCVRDLVMGRVPADYDVTTSARVDEMRHIFSAYKIVDSGAHFGTLTIMINQFAIEVTTYRTESEYADSRHPTMVTFVSSLSEDLIRRDFTMNALAMDAEGHIVDEVGGCSDISAGLIRAVGQADERFSEDPLRIMRALRFAAELEFDIEEDTFSAMLRMHERLTAISSERIYAEINRLLCAAGVAETLIVGRDIFFYIFKMRDILEQYQYKNQELIQSAWIRTATAVGSVNKDFAVRLGALAMFADYLLEGSELLHHSTTDIREAKLCRISISKNVQKSIKCGKNVKFVMEKIAKHVDEKWAADATYFRGLLYKFGEAGVWLVLEFIEDLAEAGVLPRHIAEPETLVSARNTISQIFEDGDCWSLSCLAVNGADIESLGVPRGECIGKLLELCVQRVIRHPEDNRKETLLAFAKNQFDLIK